MQSRRSTKIGNRAVQEHLNAIRIHNWEMGGTIFGIVGLKGCGKTHLMLRLAHQILYRNPNNNKIEPETVIWRGRELDYWNWMFEPDFEWEGEEFKREVHIHYWAHDVPHFSLETGEPQFFPHTRVHKYANVHDLYKNLQQGQINVIYEPTTYQMSEGMSKLIGSRIGKPYEEIGESIIDSPLWWVELMFFLYSFKRAGFITIILDEVDEIFPADIAGLRWHIHALFADTAKDFRKTNISLIYSIHDLTDLDYRIRSKTQYWGWMKNARILKSNSLVDPLSPVYLQRGDIIIECGSYGKTNLGKFKERLRVRVHFPTGVGDKTLWERPAVPLGDLEPVSYQYGQGVDNIEDYPG